MSVNMNVNQMNSSWEKTTKKHKTIYKCPEDNKNISKVRLDSKFGTDTLELVGKSVEVDSLYKEIKKTIDPKYTKIPFGDVMLVEKKAQNEIWISLPSIYSKNPGDVKPLLDKIYSIVKISLPIFSKLIPEITNELINLSRISGCDYLNLYKEPH